jgi:periplasmic protein TonB
MMSEYVDYRAKPSGTKQWLKRCVIGIGMLSFVGAVVWGGINLSHGPSAPKRQLARIMILPDTPPPPPPPEEKRPPPKEEQPRQQIETPKQETPPAPEQLKMEGQAGEGPSAFAAGEVKQEYIGGDIGNGSRYAAYVARLEDQIQTELTKHKLRLASVKLFMWLSPDGSIQRFSVAGGDDEASRSVRTALADMHRVDEAPVADMPMPVGLQISVR